MAETINKHIENTEIKSKPIIPQKTRSSFLFEEESKKVFLALDFENHLYLWFLKNEIIDAVSLLDESESEERKNLFPDLCFNLAAFIAKSHNYSKDRRIFISSFGYLGNSNRKYIKLAGNFDSIVMDSQMFFEYVKNQFAHNCADLNNYESILSDSVDVHFNAEDRKFKMLENNLTRLNDNSLLDPDMDKNLSKHDINFSKHQQLKKQRKLRIIPLNIPNESFFSINDYSFLKSEEERITNPITDLIQFSLAEKNHLISTNESSKILIASFSTGKIIQKLNILNAKNFNKIQITSIKQIPDFNFTQNTSEFNVVLGSSNGLLYFYTIKTGLDKTGENKDLDIIFELKGIFSVFQNKYFDFIEVKEKINSQIELYQMGSKHLEILAEDFLKKNDAKETEPVNTIEVKDNILFAGLNSFVLKFNLKLNLLTQVMPSLAPVNSILNDNGMIYVSCNSRNLLLFESRGVLVSKVDTSLNCIYSLDSFWVKKRKYLLCCGNKNYLEVIANDSNFKLVF